MENHHKNIAIEIMNETKLLELIQSQNRSIELLGERLDIANERINNLYDHVIKRSL